MPGPCHAALRRKFCETHGRKQARRRGARTSLAHRLQALSGERGTLARVPHARAHAGPLRQVSSGAECPVRETQPTRSKRRGNNETTSDSLRRRQGLRSCRYGTHLSVSALVVPKGGRDPREHSSQRCLRTVCTGPCKQEAPHEWEQKRPAGVQAGTEETTLNEEAWVRTGVGRGGGRMCHGRPLQQQVGRQAFS